MSSEAPQLELITPKGLREALWRWCGHINAGRVHYHQRECVTYPGLSLSDAYDKRTRKTTRTFFVAGDQAGFGTIQAAAKAWNDQWRGPTIEALAAPQEQAA